MAVATGLRFLLPRQHTLSLRRKNKKKAWACVSMCFGGDNMLAAFRQQQRVCVDVSHALACYSDWMWKYFFVQTDLSLKGFDDEVQRVRLDTFDALLHHMVTVLVLYALQHVAVQLPHHLALQRRRRRRREGQRGGGVRRGTVIVCEKSNIAWWHFSASPSFFIAAHSQTNNTGLLTDALQESIGVY